MVFGMEITLSLKAVIGLLTPDTEVHPVSYSQRLQCHDIARKALRKQTVYQKRHYDIRATKRFLATGQAVWLYNPTRRVGVCFKLTCKWKGPYHHKKVR